jgi:hypothetical protein
MTAKNTNASTELPKQFAESTSAYLERVEQAHARFAERFEASRARTSRIADQLTESLVASQRNALELTKAVAAEPAAYGKNMEAFMASLNTAQERALETAKVLYREQADAASELRSSAETLFESSKTLAKPFEKMTSMWMPAAK